MLVKTQVEQTAERLSLTAGYRDHRNRTLIRAIAFCWRSDIMRVSVCSDLPQGFT
jgi:hypothetical protein